MSEEQEVEQLFELAPEAFVAARDQAAARLRRAGDREAAARVKALRRPPLAAWAVNQLARGHRAEVDRLLEAGARLRAAHQAALAGRGAAELRAATKTERETASRLVAAAVEVLRASGHPVTETTRERIAASLHAAASDPAAAELVRSGRLTGDLDPAGFEALATGPAPPGNGEPSAPEAGPQAAAHPEPEAGPTPAEGSGGAGRQAAPAASGARAAEREGKAGQAAASSRARRQAATAAWDHARRRARLAADQAVLATRHAERLGRLADQAEREATRARTTASAAIEAAAAARRRAAKAARELADAEARLTEAER